MNMRKKVARSCANMSQEKSRPPIAQTCQCCTNRGGASASSLLTHIHMEGIQRHLIFEIQQVRVYKFWTTAIFQTLHILQTHILDILGPSKLKINSQSISFWCNPSTQKSTPWHLNPSTTPIGPRIENKEEHSPWHWTTLRYTKLNKINPWCLCPVSKYFSLGWWSNCGCFEGGCVPKLTLKKWIIRDTGDTTLTLIVERNYMAKLHQQNLW